MVVGVAAAAWIFFGIAVNELGVYRNLKRLAGAIRPTLKRGYGYTRPTCPPLIGDIYGRNTRDELKTCPQVKLMCCIVSNVVKCNLMGTGNCIYYEPLAHRDVDDYYDDSLLPSMRDDNDFVHEDVIHLFETLLILDLSVLTLIASLIHGAMDVHFVLFYCKNNPKLAVWMNVRFYLFMMDGLIFLLHLIALIMVSNESRPHLAIGFAISVLLPVSGIVFIVLARKWLRAIQHGASMSNDRTQNQAIA